MKIKKQDIIICGFALFAIFFGAGNLIFPPYLGVSSGEHWWQAALGFLLSDPFFPILGVIVTMSLGGRADDLGQRVHPNFAKILAAIAILLIGPLFSVPRTGATTHEILILPFFPDSPQWLTSLIFFSIVTYVAIKPNQVINAIGKYLTPILLVILTIICLAAFFKTPGEQVTSSATNLSSTGFKEGYQTMDGLGAALMAGIVIEDLERRGYKDKPIQLKAGIWVGLLAFVLLALVYGSLTFAGAQVSSLFSPDQSRTAILIGMVEYLLGPSGKFIMGICVALACLTTAVGLTSVFASYFYGLFYRRIAYRTWIFIAVAVEFVISLIGVNQIINIAVPVLSAIYPITMTLILFSIFDKKITYNATYIGAVIGAGVISFTQAINSFGQMTNHSLLQGPTDFIQSLPLSAYGFEWLLPSLLVATIFTTYASFTARKQIN